MRDNAVRAMVEAIEQGDLTPAQAARQLLFERSATVKKPASKSTQAPGPKARNPFRKAGERGFLGGGPEDQGWYVHIPSANPWDCMNTGSPYQHVCRRTNPDTGDEEVIKRNFDPDRVKARNKRYRGKVAARAHLEKIGQYTPVVNPDGFPVVRFSSHKSGPHMRSV